MRKLFTVLAVCLLLVSCATTKKTNVPVANPDAPVSEAQASYAMSYVLSKAQEKAENELYYSIQDTNLIPTPYRAMENASQYVPGLQSALTKHKKEMSDFILKVLEANLPLTNNLIADFTFQNAVLVAARSNTSATDTFQKSCYDTVRQSISSDFADADFSDLEKARKMYNVYQGLMSYLENISTTQLEAIDYSEYFTTLTTDLYFNTLRQCEQLIRTTPDPYQDAYITQVLGNW